MCVSPTFLPGSVDPKFPLRERLVACRYCWQCRLTRMNDLVGRGIAEQSVSADTVAVTLTYSGDHANSAVLIYADFQKFMKRLRKAGHKVRYLVAGEYGSKKGRSHWHALLFFKREIEFTGTISGERPARLGPYDWITFPLETNYVMWDFWPHGYSFFQRPDYDGFAYVMKYALKDDTAEVSTGHLAMSKKPPLGYEFFMGLADQHVAQAISPQSGHYSFRHLFDRKGKRRKFFLRGRMRELYLDRFASEFRRLHGRDCPESEFLQDHEDRQVRLARQLTDDEWRAVLAEKRPRPRPVASVAIEPAAERSRPEHVSEAEYLVIGGERKILAVRYSDGAVEFHYGKGEKWLVGGDEIDSASERLRLSSAECARLKAPLPRGSNSPLDRPASSGWGGARTGSYDPPGRKPTTHGDGMRPRPLPLRRF